ncbi:MAG TPA: MXAN_5187 C-terminal domain-containing protein, partial [Kofleriaceae bacterium]
DILAPANEPSIDPYFKQVYDQFVQVKKSCGEPTAGLTYGKFSEKLVKNRDDLMAKTGCREVRFTVYVKDGKAALKATPVKDE